MKKLFPLNLNRTILTHLFAPQSVAQAVAEIRGAEYDGADAAAVELCFLPEAERTKESFQAIMNASPLPYMFLCYRNDRLGWSDEKRMEMLQMAAEAGAGMVDVVGDLFDRSPDERTKKKTAIRRQMKVIEAIHKTGSQVIMSSHPLRFMTSDEVLDQLKDFARRGADVVKIVTTVNTDEEFAESIRTTMRLHRELKTPFVHLCGGKFSRIQRVAGMSLGVAITFGVHEYHDFAPYNQPTIRSFKAVQENTHWHISNYPQE